MSQHSPAAGVTAGRQAAEVIEENFSDLHPPLTAHEAFVAADRCYFCHDAPCMTACPTSIDIPLFIRQIATGTENAAAKTIFDQNILGGMCARVCPTETLCEQACVREAAEGKPVEIGLLQRFATDSVMSQPHPYTRAPDTGKRIAVAGAGPAGLACAHRLAMHGHAVTVFDSRNKAGGLNEFGIAAYKAPNNFAQDELNWLLSIGGITIETGKALGSDIALADLQADYDAIFLSIGLAGVNALSLEGRHASVIDAVDWIADMRQSADKTDIAVGRDVVVIGGGMTAVDAAVQARLLGAETVTIAYRRGQENMSASRYEQDLATSKGVHLLFNATPKSVSEGSITFTRTGSDEEITLPADQVMRAIGQTLDGAPDSIALEGGKIRTDDNGRSSVTGIWAGGDCASGGEDLTVTAVAQGRDAAEDIHHHLMGGA
ncbi:NAD(P)-dependent oxidoreductase [Coralliovum pocilloporae]|uniref:NAD(P)-dependent oxidoreductase n=1 Tax=Coralliovum pocilloporae TaxID=3066369 RepID=UPI003306BBF1